MLTTCCNTWRVTKQGSLTPKRWRVGHQRLPVIISTVLSWVLDICMTMDMVFLCSCQSLEVVLNHQTASGKGSLLALSRCWSWHSMQSLELRCTRTYCDQERSSDWFTDFVRSLRQKGSEGWMPKLCAWEAFHAVNCCTAGSPTQINSCQAGGQEDCSLLVFLHLWCL